MTPRELASIIQASLDDDHTGMTKVRPARQGDQANARPIDWFCALKRVDSRARNLESVAQLPPYLMALVESRPPTGRRPRHGSIIQSDLLHKL